jgi:hypothetical protein
MPVTWLDFTQPGWAPDTGDQGSALAICDNLLPLHGSYRSIQQALIQSSVADGPVTGAMVHIFQQQATQKSNPNADTTPGIWQPSTGTTMFTLIGTSTPNDATFAYAPGAPSSQAATFALSAITNPGTTSGLLYQVRYAIPATTGAWSLVAKLLQNPGATVIASNTVSGTGPQPGFLQQAWNLTSGQAGAITNFADLALELIATVAGTGQVGYAIADVMANGWTTDTGSGSNLYVPISTTPAQSTHYVQSVPLSVGATSGVYSFQVTSLLDPTTRTAHVLKTEMWATNSGVTVTVNIMQGSVIVGTSTVTNISTTPGTPQTVAIPVSLASGITDYTSLTGQITASYPTSVTSTVQQIAQPTGMISIGSGTNSWAAVGAVTQWQAISQSYPPNDSIYMQSGGGGLPAYATFSLPSLLNPQTNVGLVLKMRCWETGGRSGPVNCYIKQGTGGTYPGDYPGVALLQVAAPTTTPTLYTYTLQPADVAAITDFTQLALVVETARPDIRVSFVDFEVPQPRQGIVSYVELDVPSTAQMDVSWADFEAPAAGTTYQGDVPTIYAGTKNSIYTVASSGWTNQSISGGYAAGSSRPSGWRFLQAGPDIYATNYVDQIQIRQASSGLFKNLIADPSPAPQARFMALIRSQFLVLADINLSGYGPDYIWWSAAGNPTSFTPSATTLANYGFLRSRPGQIMGITGGDSGLIFKRNSIHSLTWTGDSNVFRLDELTSSVGTPYPNSIVEANGCTYWWGGSSFWMYNGTPAAGSLNANPVPIGGDILSSYLTDEFQRTSDIIQLYSPPDMESEDQIMVGWYDANSGLCIWSYMGPSDPPWQRSRMVIYSPGLNQWTHVNLSGASTPLQLAFGCKNMNSISSDSHALRGTFGFTWDGTNSNWIKFSNTSCYAATIKTQIRAISMEKADSPIGPRLRGYSYISDPKQDYPIRPRIREVVPIFSDILTFVPGVPAWPTLTIECSEDPFARTAEAGSGGSYRNESFTPSQVSERGAYPCNDIESFFFSFGLSWAELTELRCLYGIKGLYISWEPKSRD